MRTLNLEETIKHQSHFLTMARAKGRSDNSLKCYRLDFEVFNKFLINQKENKVDNFNTFVIKEFEHFLEKKYSNINSIRRKLQTLRLFFDYLVEKDIYHENPIKKIASAPKSILPPVPTKYPDIFMIDNYLKATIENSSSKLEHLIALRNRTIFILIYECCLNVASISGVESDDLFLGPNPRIMIRPKKRDPYTIPIPAQYNTFLTSYLDHLKAYQNEKFQFKELLFYANSHTVLKGSLSPRGIENLCKNISNHLSIKMTPKSLRQSGILKWILNDTPEATLKEWLGVAPTYNFNIYKKYISDQKEDESNFKDHLDYKHLI